MTTLDWLRLIHPTLAVVFVFPLIGIVANFALQTRQRRLQLAEAKAIKAEVERLKNPKSHRPWERSMCRLAAGSQAP